VENFKQDEIFPAATVTFPFALSPIRHWGGSIQAPIRQTAISAGVGRLSMDHLNRVGCLYSK